MSNVVDVVVTWVDGSDPKHVSKKNKWLKKVKNKIHENGIEENRWRNQDEIVFCLKSIENYADWVNKIWIVTDRQVPNIHGMKSETLNKIRVVDHRSIFMGYEDFLPTFNSVSIETFLWRIEGLAEKFIYFNDDVFLTRQVDPKDFFIDNMPVLRGSWVNWKIIEGHKLHRMHKKNAVTMLGLDSENMFSSAHVAHALKKSVLEDLFLRYSSQFIKNASYRFREKSQFLPTDLHNHKLIIENKVVFRDEKDYVNISLGKLTEKGGKWVKKRSREARNHEYTMVCVNDFYEIKKAYGKISNDIKFAIGYKSS